MNKGQRLNNPDADHVRTPDWLMKMFEGFHDPCPFGATEIKQPKPGDKIFINPPFSQKLSWLYLAMKWHQQGHYVIMLVPVETSTLFAEMLIEFGCHRIYFEKRVWGSVRGVELVILTG